MLHSRAAYIGEKVIIAVAKENREWGYDPAPDGLEVEIISFGTIEYGRTQGRRAGIYVNDSNCRVRLPDGKELDIGSFHLEHIDKKAARARQTANNLPYKEQIKKDFLRPLPPFPVYEQDFVQVAFPNSPRRGVEEGFVRFIHYADNDFDLELKTGGTILVKPENTIVIRRGPHWYYENDPDNLRFSSLENELKFYFELGHCDEIKNPRTGYYSWDILDALKAIKDGLIDCVRCDGTFFGNSSYRSHVGGYKFHDPELGARAAAETTIVHWKHL